MRIIESEAPAEHVRDYDKGLINLPMQPILQLHYHLHSSGDAIFYHTHDFYFLKKMDSLSSIYQSMADSSYLRNHMPCHEYIDVGHLILRALKPYVTGDETNAILVYIDSVSNFFLRARDIKDDYFLFEQRYYAFIDAIVRDTIPS